MRDLFLFEQDGRYPLRRIPMAMRFKLDACGIRLSLIAWALLSREQRECLVDLPCASEADRQQCREKIVQMMAPHADNPDAAIESVPVEAQPIWADLSAVPQQIGEQLQELALPAFTVDQWRALTELQRFALTKLTRSGHKNANLLPALREFGLA
jgi:hypothetical protein